MDSKPRSGRRARERRDLRVSCRATSALIELAAELSTSPLEDAAPGDVLADPALRDPRAWTRWSSLVAVCEALRARAPHLSAQALGERFAQHLERAGRARAPRDASGIRWLYEKLCGTELASCLPELGFQTSSAAEGDVELRIVLPEDCEAPAWLWQAVAGLLGGLPTLLWLRPLPVEHVVDPSGARFVVRTRLASVGVPEALETLACLSPHLIVLYDLAADRCAFVHAGPAISLFPQPGAQPLSGSDPLDERIHPEDRTALGALWRALLSDGEALPSCDVRLRDAEQHWRRIRFHGRVFEQDASGRPRSALLTGSDVSDLCRERDRNERIRDVVEVAGDVVVADVGPDGRLRYVSPQAEAVIGLTPEQLAGRSFLEFVAPEDQVRTTELFTKSIAVDHVERLQLRVTHAHGRQVWVEATARTYASEGGDRRTVAVLRDISEQKRAVQALRASEERYRSVVENSSDWVLVVGEDGRVRFQNSRAARALADLGIDAFGAQLLAFVHEDDRARLANAWQGSVLAGSEGRADFRLLWDDEPVRWFEASWRPFRTADDERVFAAAVREVSERKETERALRAVAQQLADTGRGFLCALARHIASALRADLAVVGLLDPERPGELDGVAVVESGTVRDERRFEVAGLPFAPICEGDVVCYPSGVRSLFPAISERVSPRVDSFVGVPLVDSRGRVLGLIGAFSAEPLRDPDMARSLLSVFAQRASAELERERVMSQLRETEERYRAISENAHDMLLELRVDGSVVYASPTVEDILGYPLDEVLGRPSADRIHPDDRAEVQRSFRALVEVGTPSRLVYRAAHRADGWRWLDATLHSFRTAADELRIVAVCRDFTDLTVAKREREHFISLTQNSDDLILLANLEGDLFFLSTAGRRLLGVEADAGLDDLALFECLSASDADTMRFEILPSLLRQQHWSGEIELRHAISGESISSLATFFLIEDGGPRRGEDGGPRRGEDGGPHRSGGEVTVAGICRDISEFKRVEQALRESQVRARVLADNPFDLIAELDCDERLVYVSPNVRRILGYAPEQFLGRSPLSLVLEEDSERVRDELRRAFDGNGHGGSTTFRIRRSDGQVIWLDATARRFEAPGARTAVLVTSRDITARRQAEEQLHLSEERFRQSQKMEAIGRLAGGVAHDFNNLLTAITGYSDLLMEELGPQHPSRSDAEEILRAAERAGTLTRQLLAFSRRQVLQPRVLELNALVAGLDRMLRRLVGEDVEFVSELDGELWPVMADPGQIEQVLLNLVVNARDALPRGGRLGIRTERVHLDTSDDAGPDVIPAGDYAVLRVRDSGIGIEPDVVDRIFEPFFTTKETGKGTGLGLSTVYGIVQQTGGYIRVASAPRQGSEFSVFLPRVAALPTHDGLKDPMAGMRGDETILVVEDASPVRSLVSRYLQRQGYTVLEAASGQEALRIVESHEGEIHLLLSDVVLPRMDGPEVARRVTAARPGIRVLFMSGFSDDSLSRHGMRLDEIALLEKPFVPALLLHRVRAVLNAPNEDDTGLS